MIINDLPCLVAVTDQNKIIGGKRIKFCNFDVEFDVDDDDFKKFWGDKSTSAFAYAQGDHVSASYGISVDSGSGVIKSFSHSSSQS